MRIVHNFEGENSLGYKLQSKITLDQAKSITGQSYSLIPRKMMLMMMAVIEKESYTYIVIPVLVYAKEIRATRTTLKVKQN